MCSLVCFKRNYWRARKSLAQHSAQMGRGLSKVDLRFEKKLCGSNLCAVTKTGAGTEPVGSVLGTGACRGRDKSSYVCFLIRRQGGPTLFVRLAQCALFDRLADIFTPTQGGTKHIAHDAPGRLDCDYVRAEQSVVGISRLESCENVNVRANVTG